uniref:Pentatricopeptide repeat-containing protein At4g01990, mitochondrial n=1 Tax=Anthurium amnicola TaxID=1678845 RepID=A0A1D1XK80_9ARAE
MANNAAGVPWWSSTLLRRLCTAAAEAAGGSTSASASAVGVAGATKVKPLYRRLSVLGGAPKGAVTQAMNQWLREGRGVKALQVVTYVKELRKYRRFQHALELMEWMDGRGMYMSYSNYAVRLDLVCKVEGIDSAEKYFSRLSAPAKNRLTYGALLNCYCIESKVDKALSLFEEMKELNFASHALPYATIMALHMRLGQPEKVPPLMQEMVEKKIPPDSFNYSILMKSYAAVKDIESVERTVEEIKKSDKAEVMWPIYSHLASVYISAGLIEKAEAAIKMLEQNIDRRDRKCFHFLISLYAGVGKLEDVCRVWNSLKAAFPTTLNMSYFSMLQSLNRMDEFDALVQCFQEWESSHVAYDIRLTNIMFAVYLRRDMIEEAESLLKSVIRVGAEPNFRTYVTFIDYYLKKQRIDLALCYLEDAVLKVKNHLIKLSQETVNGFLRYFEEHKDVDGAEAFCNTLKKLDCFDSEAYGSLQRIRESRTATESAI